MDSDRERAVRKCMCLSSRPNGRCHSNDHLHVTDQDEINRTESDADQPRITESAQRPEEANVEALGVLNRSESSG